ncbi:MAG: alkaline phosphatase family protein [Bacteroidales bacterium]
MKSNVFYLMALLGLFIILLSFSGCTHQHGHLPAKRVILIGIDGVGVQDLQQAMTPNLDSIIGIGALSLTTRGVMPTVSGPNWSSHLLGAGPEQHGITSNGWTVDNHSVKPTITDKNGYFPSVFNLIKEQMPASKTAMFYDWDALINYYNPAYIDKLEYSGNYIQTFEMATSWIIENNPAFTFLYIGEPDEMGHEHQWHSPEYIESIEKVDQALGNFFLALKKNGLFEETHFIIVTDHGGVGYGHGGLSMDEIEIPWIISGPGVIRNKIIEQPNNVFNTASTIAYLFSLDQPVGWIGKPVYGAFISEKEFAGENINSYVPQPFFSIRSGLYTEYQIVELSIGDPSTEIRFETNGNPPTQLSNLYKSPIYLQRKNAIVLRDLKMVSKSRLSKLDFRVVLDIEELELKYGPSEKYYGKGISTLSDLIVGSNDFKDGEWLGFEGDNLEAELGFEKIQDINKIALGCLNLPGSWIFLPKQIGVFASVDGRKYIEIGRKEKSEIYTHAITGRNEIEIPLTRSKAKYLKIIAQNEGVCPNGHPGEGKKAWLFIDEIILENN